ncbi:hypothetical protein APASM_2041 [Actinosynnema pretiosum subsp. pretiosum]|nr:hypothetical protein APASM_2041 [Actinosynnema pretiosum subsp. pretiosum]
MRIAADAEAKIRVADAEAARKLEAQRARIELERLQAEADRVNRAERDVERRAERQRRQVERRERRAERGARRAELLSGVLDGFADKVVVVPVLMAMAGAWWGQFQVFHQRLSWPVPLAAAAATGIECIGVVCGRLAHLARRQVTVVGADGVRVTRDDSAWVERSVMWAVVGYAAASNWAHAGDPTVGALSVVGVAVWEARERRVHRLALAEAGRLPARRPKFGAVRWVRYPGWTWRAWSAALRHGLVDAAEALAVAERETAERKVRKASRRALGWRSRRRFGRVVAARLEATDQARREAAEAVIREAQEVTGAAAMLFGPRALTEATRSRPTSENVAEVEQGGTGRRSWRWGRPTPASAGLVGAAEATGTAAGGTGEHALVVVDGVDITDLMPTARTVAAGLGDRLNRDGLLDGLREAGLSVGGRRRKAVYDAVLAERDRVAA